MSILVAVLLAGVLGTWWRRRRRAAHVLDEARAAVPEFIELLVLLIRAGLTPSLAFGVMADSAPGPLRGSAATVHQRTALGVRFADALDALRDDHGVLLDPLASLLSHADRHGEPIAPILDRLATEARNERRRLAEADARRLPVRLCFPLVGCVLPSFVVLTIVPMMLGMFSSLAGVTP